MLKLFNYLKKINIKFILVINLIFTTLVLLFWIIDKKIPPFGSSLNSLFYQNYIKKQPALFKVDDEIENKIMSYKLSLNISDNAVINTNEVKDLFWANEIINGRYILHILDMVKERNGMKHYMDLITMNCFIKKMQRNETWYRATCMTERGIETSKSIKRGFEHADIKIHKVLSSPSCRARETAVYAFGRIDELHSSLLHYSALNPLDKQKFALNLKKLFLNLK